MAVVNPYQVYKNQSIMLASPEELTLMLYNGCGRFIRQAEEAIKGKNISDAHKFIIRSQDIIQELMQTLNMEYEVSNGLLSLYEYIYQRLIEANIKKDTIILNEVLDMVIELRDTWEDAMQLRPRRAAVAKG